MIAEVLHPVDVDPYIWCPLETLYQSPSSIVHTHPGNDLGDKKPVHPVRSTYDALAWIQIKTWQGVCLI